WTSLTDPLLLIVAGSNAYSNCGLPCGGEPQGVTTGGLYAYMLNGGSWQPLDVYAPQSMGALTMIDAVATDGVTVVADGSMQSPSGSIQNGIVVMQVGSIPSSGYSIVPSYKATPSSPPPTGQPSSSSGGGGFLWEILLLSVLWGVRQLQQNRKA
ncbi:MAG TPA: hypothetical protein VNF46_03870, partial [Gammaproteobacteria bacterium]|nr:hypothetical protein [Gammaproteobacteria bacterium]